MQDTANAETKLARYLFNVVWSILFQIHRPSDLEVGLTIQVGGLDEADLHSNKQNSHASSHHHNIKNTGETAVGPLFCGPRGKPGLLAFQLMSSDVALHTLL